MKKVLTHLFALASVIALFAGCSKEVDNQVKTNGSHIVTFVADQADTRTAVVEGNSAASYIWNSTDAQYLHVYENGIKATEVSLSLEDGGAVGTITASFPNSDADSFVYKAYYGEKSNSGNFKVLDIQNPKASSFDPKSDILISDETEPSVKQSDLKLRFGRVAVINKVTLKGMTAGEVVSKVTLTGSAALAGSYAEATVDDEGNPVDAKWNAGSKTLTFEAFENATVNADGEFPIYFVSIPFEGTIGISVTTNQNQYDRNDITTILKFEVGKMTRFGLKLNGYGSPISTGTPYSLVSTQAELADGATYLLVGSYNNKFYALGEQKTNNRNAVEVEESNDVITVNNTVAAFPVIIEKVGEYYTIMDANPSSDYFNQYLTADNESKNYLHSTATVDDKALWSISVTEGVVRITNKGNEAKDKLCFNPNVQSGTPSPLFSAYGSLSGNITTDVALYVDESTCVVEPSIVAPANVTVGYKGVEAEALNYVLKNLEGTVDVTCDGEVVTEAVDMEDGTIAYTVSRNAVNFEDSENEAREGWIKITVGEVSATVTVHQNAAPANVLTVEGLIDGKIYLGANAGDQTTIMVTSNYEWNIDWDYIFNVDGIDESFTPVKNHGNVGDEENNVSEAVLKADLTNDSTEDRFLGQIGLYRDCDYAGLQNIQVWQRGKAATPAPAGSGSWDDPYNAAAALEEIAKLADNAFSAEVFVSGTISQIDEISTSFGNATYHITSGNTTVEVFRGKYFNGVNFTAEDQLTIGDVVTVYGKLQKYVKDGTTTPEIAQGNILFTLNGETHMMAPTVSAEVDNDNKTISISWNSVAAATSYDVTCGTQTKTGLTSTSCSFTVTDYGKYDITVTAKAAGLTSVEGTTSATLTDPSSSTPAPETIVFADLGLENGVQYLEPFDGGNFTITFAGGGNDGKYYTTGQGIRVYAGGSFTVASTYTIANIEFTWDGSNAPTSDVASPAGYSTSTKTWTGEAKSIILTRPSGSGHWRLKKVTVTYK